MLTQRTIANRANAGLSTGPRTEAGKERSSWNAMKHGMRAERVVVPGEDGAEFEEMRERVMGELGPEGFVEMFLGERVVLAMWRLRRAVRVESEVMRSEMEWSEEYYRGGGEGTSASGAAGTLGASLEDAMAERGMLTNLRRYEGQLERGMYRAMRELKEKARERSAVSGQRSAKEEEAREWSAVSGQCSAKEEEARERSAVSEQRSAAERKEKMEHGERRDDGERGGEEGKKCIMSGEKNVVEVKAGEGVGTEWLRSAESGAGGTEKDEGGVRKEAMEREKAA